MINCNLEQVSADSLNRQWVSLTGNELAWMEFLRLIAYGAVPSPTLFLVQAVRLAFRARKLRP